MSAEEISKIKVISLKGIEYLTETCHIILRNAHIKGNEEKLNFYNLLNLKKLETINLYGDKDLQEL